MMYQTNQSACLCLDPAEVIRPLPTPTPLERKSLFAVGEVEDAGEQREPASAVLQPNPPSEPRPIDECVSILRNPEVRTSTCGSLIAQLWVCACVCEDMFQCVQMCGGRSFRKKNHLKLF